MCSRWCSRAFSNSACSLVRRKSKNEQTAGNQKPSQPSDDNFTFMTWNILAPMWIDIGAMEERGIVDMNLLNDEVRLLFIVDRVMTQKPDILQLQEVQEEAFTTINRALASSYSTVGFACNRKEYWKSQLAGNQNYTKNGVATFYRKDKFELMSHKEFETSPLGSVALLGVLKHRESFGVDTRITSVNCHLETGVTQEQADVRVDQSNVIMKMIDEEISRNPNSVAIIAGDLNTQHPYPAYTNFKSNGYLDAADEVPEIVPATFYYDSPVAITETATTEQVFLDHVFIREADKSSGKIKVISVYVPVVASPETTMKYYAEKLQEILTRNVESTSKIQSQHVLNSDLYSQIQKAGQNRSPTETDNKVNQVLRLGSDHLPMTVTLHIS